MLRNSGDRVGGQVKAQGTSSILPEMHRLCISSSSVTFSVSARLDRVVLCARTINTLRRFCSASESAIESFSSIVLSAFQKRSSVARRWSSKSDHDSCAWQSIETVYCPQSEEKGPWLIHPQLLPNMKNVPHM